MVQNRAIFLSAYDNPYIISSIGIFVQARFLPEGKAHRFPDILLQPVPVSLPIWFHKYRLLFPAVSFSHLASGYKPSALPWAGNSGFYPEHI